MYLSAAHRVTPVPTRVSWGSSWPAAAESRVTLSPVETLILTLTLELSGQGSYATKSFYGALVFRSIKDIYLPVLCLNVG